MNKKAKKRTVFVTGATDGLGLALVERLFETHKVVVISRDKEKTRQLAKKYGCEWGVCDVGDWASVSECMDDLVPKVGDIDCLVHCAGIYAVGKLEGLSPETILSTFETNTLGTIYVTKAILPYMIKQKAGQIVFINSTVGYKHTERSGNWLYPLSKTSAMDFANVMGSELAPDGINVSIVYPGVMQTKFAEKGTGVKRDLSNGLSTSEVTWWVEQIINNPKTRLNGLAITHLNDYQK
jgi:short-subunit dehydrogenase